MRNPGRFIQGLLILAACDRHYLSSGHFAVDHDRIHVGGVRPVDMSETDVARLKYELGFDWDEMHDTWMYYV